MSINHLCVSVMFRGLTVNGSSVGWNQTHHCKLLDGLAPDQLQLCRRNLELMHSIVHAAKLTKSACQNTFKDMRWNCSSIESAPHFTPDLAKGRHLNLCDQHLLVDLIHVRIDILQN